MEVGANWSRGAPNWMLVSYRSRAIQVIACQTQRHPVAFLLLLITILTTIFGTQGALNSTERQVVADAFRTLCPESNVCASSDVTDDASSAYTCCTACSCEPDCGEEVACCFPEDDRRYSQLHTGQLECLFLHTIQKPRTWTSRYFLISGTKAQTLGSHGNSTVYNTSCGDVNVAPWGSMYPVYSISTRKIYKNDVCAKVNGIEDVIHFNAEIVCDVSPFMQLMLSLEYLAPWIDDCDVYFSRTEDIPADDLLFEECFLDSDMTSSCTEREFTVPTGIHMTEGQVRELCGSGVVSPWRTNFRFANPFCQICWNNFVEQGLEQNNGCSAKNADGRFSRSSMTIILKPEIIKLFGTGLSRDPVTSPKACLRPSGLNMETNSSDCRVIHCPTGQLRNRTTGQCSFPATHWNMGGYTMYLKLTPDVTLLNADIGDQPIEISRFVHSMRACIVMSLYTSYSGDKVEEVANITANLSVTYFVAVLYCPGKHVDPSHFLSSIHRNMAKPWSFATQDGTDVPLQASFLEFRVLLVTMGLYMADWHLLGNESFVAPTFQHVYEIRRKEKQFLLKGRGNQQIQKLFYCEQVDLQEDEYKLLGNDFLLMYLPTNKTLHALEFDLAQTNTGTNPRICLYDSNLVKKENHSDNGASCMDTMATYTWIVTWLLYLVQLIQN